MALKTQIWQQATINETLRRNETSDEKMSDDDSWLPLLQEQNGMHVVQRQVSDGRSFIRLAKVEFHRNPKVAGKYRDLDGDTGLVEVLVFEVGERDLIGHVMDDGSRRFCCTADLAPKIRCKENHLIVKVWRAVLALLPARDALAVDAPVAPASVILNMSHFLLASHQTIPRLPQEHAEGGKNTPWLTEVWFQGNSTEAHAPPTTLLPITTTGMYHL